MQICEYYLIFPDGDQVEVPVPPRLQDLLDANGRPLALPLKTEKTLAFRVAGKRTVEKKGFTAEIYRLEQMSAAELLPYVR